ncbi:glycoside hydrolase family 5 protein [Diplodia corticola]|uniref:glucan 1,3-beta-glucosidase n=1 Tax=Diplodia corticola TaxID=236234 RepID=A0A1J9QKT7_9PEZI|nr:glycoside hydrolase family 5 protein [Diplodia corticola]OJD29081.1 glycoside hydrolase family 5 protein [Diplodia corticola]
MRFIHRLLALLIALAHAFSSAAEETFTPQAAAPSLLRGVNLGGWLVLEPFLTPELFKGTSAVDQWTFDSQAGSEEALRQHWETYCTENDIKKLASYGVNALRIGIGFWAYDNAGTPYKSGADTYLDKAIQWAKNAGLVVVVELHGAPGSQNGDASSGHVGSVEWQTSNGNLERTTKVLTTIAQKYATKGLANTVVAIELVNEPTNNPPNTLTITKNWTETAYDAVRNAAGNKDLRIAMHDQWTTPKSWLDVHKVLNGKNPNSFVLDVHQYQIFTNEDRSLDQPGHIQKVCTFASEQLAFAKSNGLPIHIGEFSGNTFICVNPDGTTFADAAGTGKACKVDGCQCETDGGIKVDEWSEALTQQVRRYVEAQLYMYEKYAGGWFFWNFKGPGSWGFIEGVEKGFIPHPVTDRRYPNPCP